MRHQYLHMWNIYHIHFVLFKYEAKNKWKITDFVDFLYSRPPLSAGDVFQEPQWMPKTMDSTRPHLYCLLSYATGTVASIAWEHWTNGGLTFQGRNTTAQDFITQFRTAHNVKLINFLFLGFSIWHLWTIVDTGNWNCKTMKKGRTIAWSWIMVYIPSHSCHSS